MRDYICRSPILLLSFNRLDTLKQVLSIVEVFRPSKIYFANDGARKHKLDSSGMSEEESVAMVRDFILERVKLFDFPCEVHTRFLESNLGCKLAVSSAISWFFANEDCGIILEDDCLPNESFFRFCDAMLERYKDNPQIFMVSGWSALDFDKKAKDSLKSDYFFSKYNHIWGWASWRRAWEQYIREFDVQDVKLINNYDTYSEKRYWRKIFMSYAKGEIDTWDYPFTYSIWRKNGLCVYPKDNMIQNIGFNREDATHTTGESRFQNMATYELHFPLIHPHKIMRNIALDRANFRILYISLAKRVYLKLAKIAYKILASLQK